MYFKTLGEILKTSAEIVALVVIYSLGLRQDFHPQHGWHSELESSMRGAPSWALQDIQQMPVAHSGVLDN